jgi:hypothetical protein
VWGGIPTLTESVAVVWPDCRSRLGPAVGYSHALRLPGRPPHGRNAVPATGIIRPVTDDEAARLGPIVAKLLHVVPETWGTFDTATMTAAEDRALYLLTAAEMVERRLRFRVSMATAPTSLEAVLTATGEDGFGEAMKPLLAKAWSLWEERYRAWNAGDAREAPPFIVESVPPREWRLTESGVLARNDIDDGDEGGIDFVLRRGFFDGQPRVMPDGRVVARPEVVRGSGRLESLTERENGPELQRVNVANWGEGADALACRMAGMMAELFKGGAAAATAEGDGTRSDDASKPKRPRGQWLAQAMMMVRDQPELSDAKIADSVGVHPSTLCRDEEYRRVADMAREPRARPTSGRKDRSGGIEAAERAPGGAGERPAAAKEPPVPVVGQPVPGSKRRLVWERCAVPKCDTMFGVAAADLGTGQVCHECKRLDG